MRLGNPEHKNAKFLLGVPQVIIILVPHVLDLTTPIFFWNCLCQVVELMETYAFGSLHLVLRPFPYSSAASRLEEGSRGICLLFWVKFLKTFGRRRCHNLALIWVSYVEVNLMIGHRGKALGGIRTRSSVGWSRGDQILVVHERVGEISICPNCVFSAPCVLPCACHPGILREVLH